MTDHAIPVDLLNPGQVFACLGFLEAADVLLGDAEGGFDWWSDTTNVRFRLRARGEENPFERVLRFLAAARISSLAPPGTELGTEKWNIPTERLRARAPYPFPCPASPAILPVRLEADGAAIALDHWGDATHRDNIKFWGGSAGYPGAALARDALDLVRERMVAAARDPFALSAPQSSSFRFDMRRDYIPMDVGFSPNEHGDLTMVGYPLVEVLAAIGLTNARPKRLSKLEYRYSVIASDPAGGLIDPVFLRAALGGAALPFPQRFFWTKLGWPGKENQARCITDVVEETRS